MDNIITFQPCVFNDYRLGDVTFGCRVYDNYGNAFTNSWEQAIPDSDLDVLRKCIEDFSDASDKDHPFSVILRSIVDQECGVTIGVRWYEWEEIEPLFHPEKKEKSIGQELEFKCPLCKCTQLECIFTGCTCPVKVFKDRDIEFGDTQSWGDAERWQCAGCAFILANEDGGVIISDEDVSNWITDNCRSKKEDDKKPKVTTKEEYAAEGGFCCPVCKEQSAKACGPFRATGKENNVQRVKCMTCGAERYDTYTLTGYILV